MQITKLLSLYVLTAIVFFAIDMLWLGLIAKNLYQKYLGKFLGEVNWTAAIIFYLIYIAGILIFAVEPGILKDSIKKTVILGALFGAIAYATYDLTNLATLKDWPIQIVFIDILWGAVLTSTVASAGFYIYKFIQ
jgi:uncharacterized membrane protein